jgi:hypothetical protein
MGKRIMSAGGRHSRYYGQVHEKYSAPLRDDFLAQLGDDSEAEECVDEVLDYYFLYMNDRRWNPDEKLMDFRMRMIAGGVCTRRLAGRTARSADVAPRREEERMLGKVSHGVTWPVHVQTGLKQLFHRVLEGFRESKLKPLTAAFR